MIKQAQSIIPLHSVAQSILHLAKTMRHANQYHSAINELNKYAFCPGPKIRPALADVSASY